MASFGSGEKSVESSLVQLMRPSYWCQKSTSSTSGIFFDICRGISGEECKTSYHVRKLKNDNG